MSEVPARSGPAANARPVVAERAEWNSDALTGPDGTSEPRQVLAKAEFFADGTAEPALRSTVAGPLPEVPVPAVPLTGSTPWPAPTRVQAPALIPAVRRAPAAPPRPSGPLVASIPAPGLVRGSRPAQYRVPVSVNLPTPAAPPTAWAPPGDPMANQALQQFMSQFPNVSIPGMTMPGQSRAVPTNQAFPGANQPNVNRANRSAVPPVGPAGPRPSPAQRPGQRSSRGNAVWSVLVLLVIILFASGLGQQIIHAIQQAINK